MFAIFQQINNVSLKIELHFILIDLKTFLTGRDVPMQTHLCRSA